MADATQLTAVNRAIDELKATVADARGAYGEAPAFRRLMNDVERLSIDASELDTVAPAVAPPPPSVSRSTTAHPTRPCGRTPTMRVSAASTAPTADPPAAPTGDAGERPRGRRFAGSGPNRG